MYLASSKVIRVSSCEKKHDMAKSQLKQNQLYLIELKIVKVVTNQEIIQPQFRNYSTTVFDRPTLFSFRHPKETGVATVEGRPHEAVYMCFEKNYADFLAAPLMGKS